MGYQTAPHGSLGLPGGLYQFMALTEGTALPFGSEWVLCPAYGSPPPPIRPPPSLVSRGQTAIFSTGRLSLAV